MCTRAQHVSTREATSPNISSNSQKGLNNAKICGLQLLLRSEANCQTYRSEPAGSSQLKNDVLATSTVPTLPIIVDLNRPLPSIEAGRADRERHYGAAVCLAILDGEPLAKAHLDLLSGSLSPDEVAQQLWARLGTEIADRRRGAGLAVPMSLPASGLPFSGSADPKARALPDVTVVVATRDRPQTLVACLRTILSGTILPQRLIVVDNAPSTDETAQLITEMAHGAPRLHYVREDIPGLSRAHNAALPHVRTPLVAFTDDDVLVDDRWLERMVKAFGDDTSVVCVTGMIAPRELETLSQQWVEGNVIYDKGLRRMVFDAAEHRPDDPLFPYRAGAFGSGANMGFRTSYLMDRGGFDNALGAGTIAMGGDDLAAFYDVVKNGYRLVYEPASIVLHQHHRDYAALKRQTYGYGAGLGAHLTRCLLDDPRIVLVLLRHAPRALRRAATVIAPPTAAGLPPYPTELSLAQWKGLMSGPLRFIRSRRHAHRQDKGA